MGANMVPKLQQWDCNDGNDASNQDLWASETARFLSRNYNFHISKQQQHKDTNNAYHNRYKHKYSNSKTRSVSVATQRIGGCYPSRGYPRGTSKSHHNTAADFHVG
jgi:hypothetical protein